MDTSITPDSAWTCSVTPVNFSYMREGHYLRQLWTSQEGNSRCYVPENDSSRSAILGLWNRWVTGLTHQVRAIALHLSFDTFSPIFSVMVGRNPDTEFQDFLSVWEIDLSNMTTVQAQERIRDLVNQKLATLN